MEINYKEYKLSKEEKIKLLLAMILGFFCIGYMFYESIIPVLAVVLFFKYGENLASLYLDKRRKEKLVMEFKDFLYSISASFQAGRHMTESLEEAQINLGQMYSSKDHIMKEINTMLVKIRSTGETDVEALTDFAVRTGIEDIEDFTEIFRACRETGGNLVVAMNKSAQVIGEKITIENEIKTMVRQKKFEGRIITLMPVVIIIFLRVVSPDYLEIMYTTAAGRILMTLALVATFGSYLWIERITEIEV